MKEKGVFGFLKDHAAKSPVSFHMPGHKGARFFRRNGYRNFMKGIADYDITEIPGADNLFQTESIIRETADKYKKLYKSEKSYLLVNGTSCGILAAVMASVPEGSKLIMARNCHKSVFNALTLGNIEPVYAYPESVEEYGIMGPVSPEEIKRLIVENKEATAVILPSPNYYGICSDIKAISEICHRHNVTLIVDQAHGAHLKMFRKYCGKFLPPSAEESGADIVINSTHKTLASLTQSAVLNVMSERVDKALLEDKLQAVESTSPSYLLMASLDINADIIAGRGRRLFKGWKKNLDRFYDNASNIEGLRIMKTDMFDSTKINLDMSLLGLNGLELEEELNRRGIFPELITGNIVMCMTGIGNRRSDFAALYEALKDIAAGRSMCEELQNKELEETSLWTKKRELHPVPRRRKSVSLDKAAGKVCASSVIPYPPGIPLICPGEVIGSEEIEYIKYLKKEGEKVIGVDEEGKILIES